jgi:hypothetical protein
MASPEHVVTTYLCPDPWKAPAVEHSRSLSSVEMDYDEETNTCTITGRLLGENQPGNGERMEITARLVKEEDDAIACLLCRPAPERQTDPFLANLAERVNAYRLAGPPECITGCAALIQDPRLTRAASHLAWDLAASRTPDLAEILLQAQGVDFLGGASLQYFIPKPERASALTDEDLETLLFSGDAAAPGWLAGDQGARQKLFSPHYTRIGVACVFTFAPVGDPDRGWWVTVLLADLSWQDDGYELSENAAPYDWPCRFACHKKLKFFRKTVAQTLEFDAQGKIHLINIQADYLSFGWQNPMLCCLDAFTLQGDVRGPRYEIRCTEGWCKGDVPPTKSEVPMIGGREWAFDMVDIPPFPGEFFEVWGRLQGVEDECTPILMACGYFVHFCHTSGLVERILLVDDQGQIVDQRDSGATPDAWIGDIRLRYEARCEGRCLIVIPSDFARYAVGDRVVIQKGGTHKYFTPLGDLFSSGCEDPKDGTAITASLRWDVVKPVTEAQGTILPQRFWGI